MNKEHEAHVVRKDEALRMALEALEDYRSGCQTKYDADKAITAIKEALSSPNGEAQPENDCTRSHPHEEMSKECELRTEIARLTNCLARANSQAKHFEREWYLRGDEIERLTEQPKEPEQEPVAWGMQNDDGQIYDCITPEEHAREEGEYTTPLYTTPPQQSAIARSSSATPLKPLTDEQIEAIWREGIYSEGLLYEFNLFARAIEAAHGIKENT